MYKKGSKSKACNYRPISLTSIASKLLEHILVSNIISHFDDNAALRRHLAINLPESGGDM